MLRLLSAILLAGTLLFPQATLAGPAQPQGADGRQHIVQAQQSLARQFGGRKINQTWRNDDLLIVWQTRKGQRLLVEVDARNGGWKILRDENSGRR